MIEIRFFTDDDNEEVVKLVLHCQNDGTRKNITIDNQVELKDISTYFFGSGGAFWVAEVDSRIVASIGLLNCDGVGILKKFFVYPEFRGEPYHIGRRLYSTLLEFARNLKLSTLILDTPKNTQRAHKFYEKSGFALVNKSQLPLIYDCPYPQEECDYFMLKL